MKTAEELFNKAYYKKNLILDTTHMMLAVIDAEQFESALTEYNSELISEIEKKIEERKLLHQIFNTEEYNDTKLHDTSPLDVLALTEIINLIKEK